MKGDWKGVDRGRSVYVGMIPETLFVPDAISLMKRKSDDLLAHRQRTSMVTLFTGGRIGQEN
jgi:hypothetical protein